jgi:hypothetical protein
MAQANQVLKLLKTTKTLWLVQSKIDSLNYTVLKQI